MTMTNVLESHRTESTEIHTRMTTLDADEGTPLFQRDFSGSSSTSLRRDASSLRDGTALLTPTPVLHFDEINIKQLETSGVLELKNEILVLKEKLILLETELENSKHEAEGSRNQAEGVQENYKAVAELYDQAREIRSANELLEQRLQLLHKDGGERLDGYDENLRQHIMEIQGIKSRFLEKFASFQTNMNNLKASLASNAKREQDLKRDYEKKLADLSLLFENREAELLENMKEKHGEDIIEHIADLKDTLSKRSNVPPKLSAAMKELQGIIDDYNSNRVEMKELREVYVSEIDQQGRLISVLKQKVNESTNAQSDLERMVQEARDKQDKDQKRLQDLEGKYLEALRLSKVTQLDASNQSITVEELKTKNSAQTTALKAGVEELTSIAKILSNIRPNEQMTVDLVNARDEIGRLNGTTNRLREELDDSLEEMLLLRSQLGESEEAANTKKALEKIVEHVSAIKIPQAHPRGPILVDKTPLRNVADEYLKNKVYTTGHPTENIDELKVKLYETQKKQYDSMKMKHVEELDSLRLKFESILSNEERRHAEALERLFSTTNNDKENLKKKIDSLQSSLDEITKERHIMTNKYMNDVTKMKLMEEEIKNLANTASEDPGREALMTLRKELSSATGNQKKAARDLEERHVKEVQALEKAYEGKLNAKLAELNRCYHEEVDVLNEKKRTFDQSVGAINDVIRELKQTHEGLKAKRSVKPDASDRFEITKLKHELRTLEQQLKEARTLTPKTLLADATGLNKRIGEMLTNVEAARESLDRAIDGLDNATIPRIEGIDKIANLEVQLKRQTINQYHSDELAQKLEAMEVVLQKKSDQLRDHDRLKARADALEGEVHALRTVLQKYEEVPDLQNVEKTVKAIQALILEQKQKATNVDQQIQNLANSVKDFRNSDAGGYTFLKEVEALNYKVRSRDDQINALKEMIESYKDNEKQRGDGCCERGATIKELRGELACMQQEAEDNSRQLFKVIDGHKDSFGDMQKSYASLVRTHEATSRELRKLLDDNERLRDLLNRQPKTAPQTDTVSVQSRIEELRSEYQNNIELRHSYSMAQLQQCETEYEASLEVLRVKNSDMERYLSMIQSCLGRQQEAIGRLNSDVKDIGSEWEGAISATRRMGDEFPFETLSPRSIFTKLYTMATSLLSDTLWSPNSGKRTSATSYSRTSTTTSTPSKRPRYTFTGDRSGREESPTRRMWRGLASMTRN